jgi:hypothetical protein
MQRPVRVGPVGLTAEAMVEPTRYQYRQDQPTDKGDRREQLAVGGGGD